MANSERKIDVSSVFMSLGSPIRPNLLPSFIIHQFGEREKKKMERDPEETLSAIATSETKGYVLHSSA